MSKRFGRQQKRKMRKEIDRLSMDVQLLRSVGAQNRQIVENTARVLAHNFIAFEPETVEVSKPLQDWWRVHKRQISACVSLDMVPGAIRAVEETIYQIEIMKPCAFKDRIENSTHYRFACGREQVGYSISDHAYVSTPREILYEHAAKNMARMMVDAKAQ